MEEDIRLFSSNRYIGGCALSDRIRGRSDILFFFVLCKILVGTRLDVLKIDVSSELLANIIQEAVDLLSVFQDLHLEPSTIIGLITTHKSALAIYYIPLDS
jgi:hypothetical protein